MNLANKITLSRIFLVPIVMFFLLVNLDWGSFNLWGMKIAVNELMAALVFILAASTDGLDGYVARKKKMITNLGKFLDPLADKLLITAALISLVELDRLDAYVAIIIISREFAVTGLRLVAAADGKVIAASKMGKLKTVLQIVAIVILILNNIPFSYVNFPMDELVLFLAVLVTIVSGIDYFYKNRHIIDYNK